MAYHHRTQMLAKTSHHFPFPSQRMAYSHFATSFPSSTTLRLGTGH
ncbi:hypothetical protein CFP56_015544 [Quercus suber]|uniref:Uncharacterized protein n=1 Tax=Quercus suber TaxID=58331 RepID=A0AAW0KRD5_QUESU